jgi:hypothetical protein
MPPGFPGKPPDNGDVNPCIGTPPPMLLGGDGNRIPPDGPLTGAAGALSPPGSGGNTLGGGGGAFKAAPRRPVDGLVSPSPDADASSTPV